MQPSLSYVENLARQSGAILRAGYDKEHQVGYKGVIDLVTEVDHESEELLLGEIQRDFPDHHIFSEESGVIQGSDEHVWYVDPLDGTVNYAHRVPIFCVSIAYAFRGALTLGAVYDPMREEMFLAERGKGAYSRGSDSLCYHIGYYTSGSSGSRSISSRSLARVRPSKPGSQ